MKVLIIGLGSIAKKHIAALRKLNPDVCFYALRSGDNANEVVGVTNVSSLDKCADADFIIISNPTALHADAIKQVAHLKKPLFIEKPPFHNLESVSECLSVVEQQKILTYTAFNLRFLDCLTYVKKNADINKVQEVNVYCGSYLPNWRPDTDYKKIYSANAAMGGGVHLDLIHELDYVLWIFGKPVSVQTTFRSVSKLNIDAVDYANYVLSYPSFTINVVLNYYRRDTKRCCEIVFDNETWNVDLIKNKISTTADTTLIYQSEQTVVDTYTKQMEYYCTALATNKAVFNTLEESVETLKIALL